MHSDRRLRKDEASKRERVGRGAGELRERVGRSGLEVQTGSGRSDRAARYVQRSAVHAEFDCTGVGPTGEVAGEEGGRGSGEEASERES